MRVMMTMSMVVLFVGTAFNFTVEEENELGTATIKWYSLEEAVEAQQSESKKIFIDVYTDWCGWCKVMDSKTFIDPTVIKYINEHFYAVKLDAEQKESIQFNGHSYEYISRGSKGVNELAPALLDNKLSYPAFVVLGADLQKMGLFKGYSEPQEFMTRVNKIIGKEGS